VQRGEQALGGGALRLQRAVGQEAGAVQRDALLQAGCRIVLDELDRTAAGEEGEHRIGLGGGDLGQQGLEFDVREGQVQLLDDLAAALFEGLLEALDRFVTGRVLPGDGDGLLVTLLGHHFAHGIAGLPVGEAAAEDVGRAHGAGHRIGTGVGHDQQRAGVLGHLGHGHGHAGVHGADQHVHVVALDQLVDVVGGLGRVGLVVDLDELDLAPAELAALLLPRAGESRSQWPRPARQRCRCRAASGRP
jgi:hypothetical protein